MKKAILLGLLAAATTLGACDKLFKVASPQRKPGYWVETVQSDRSPTPIVSKWCFDEASDRRMPVLPKGPRRAGSCPKFAVTKNGDSYVVDSVCNLGQGGGVTITSHAVISGDYASKYTIVSTVDLEGAPDPTHNGKHNTTVTAVYQGADCPTELAPGQMERPDGTVEDMAQLRGGGFTGGGGGGNHGGASNATGGASTGSNSMGGGNATAPTNGPG
jgi:hypothetical protein